MSQSKTKKLGIYIKDENGNIISRMPADADLQQVLSGLLKAFQRILCDNPKNSFEAAADSSKNSKKAAEASRILKKLLEPGSLR